MNVVALKELVLFQSKGSQQKIFRLPNGIVAVKYLDERIHDLVSYLISLRLESPYQIAQQAIKADKKISRGLYICTTHSRTVCKISIDGIIDNIKPEGIDYLCIENDNKQYAVISPESSKTLFGEQTRISLLPEEYSNMFGFFSRFKNKTNDLFYKQLHDLLMKRLFQDKRVDIEIYALLKKYLELEYKSSESKSPLEINAC